MQTSTSGLLSFFSALGSAPAALNADGEAVNAPAFAGLLQGLLPSSSGEALPMLPPTSGEALPVLPPPKLSVQMPELPIQASKMPLTLVEPAPVTTELTTLFAQIAYGRQPLPGQPYTEPDEELPKDEVDDGSAILGALAAAVPADLPPTDPVSVTGSLAVAADNLPVTAAGVIKMAQGLTADTSADVQITPPLTATDSEETANEQPPASVLTNKTVKTQTPTPMTLEQKSSQPLAQQEALNTSFNTTAQVIEHSEAKHGLHQQASLKTPEASAAAMAPANAKLDLSQDTQQWGGALSSRIVAMISDDVQEARIHLDPPELGSLEIKLHIQQQQAVVQVQAQHGHVREVLEANAQRLRDALAEQGIELSGFDVSERSAEQGHEQGGQSQNSGYIASGDGLVDEDFANSPAPTTVSLNLLDTFA